MFIETDLKMPSSFPTGPSNYLLPELLIYLPEYPKLPFPNFIWGNVDGEEFKRVLIMLIMKSFTGNEIVLKSPLAELEKHLHL